MKEGNGSKGKAGEGIQGDGKRWNNGAVLLQEG